MIAAKELWIPALAMIDVAAVGHTVKPVELLLIVLLVSIVFASVHVVDVVLHCVEGEVSVKLPEIVLFT
ncbi:MAG TPA: hypothetical protein VN108_07425, partial [Marmoricola sp.]|nr:hypothetical protein [Marmoricola sp.]